MKLERVVCCTLVVAVLSFAFGCGGPKSPLNRANFEKIKEDMTLEEVEAILGKGEPYQPAPEENLPLGFLGRKGDGLDYISITYVEWKEETKRIRVAFFDGKLAVKEQEGL